MSSMKIRLALCGCALLLWLAPAMASDYIPLYVGYDAWLEHEEIADQFYHWWIDEVDGDIFFMNRAMFLPDGTQEVNQVWSLSRSDEDDVLLRGGYFGTWVEFDPLPLIDAPLYAGKTWDNQVDAPVGRIRVRATCIDEEDLEVHGQTMHCFVVEYELLHGLTVYSAGTLWLVDDVGIVKIQYNTGVYHLLPPVVGTQATTWSGVKAIFD